MSGENINNRCSVDFFAKWDRGRELADHELQQAAGERLKISELGICYKNCCTLKKKRACIWLLKWTVV